MKFIQTLIYYKQYYTSQQDSPDGAFVFCLALALVGGGSLPVFTGWVCFSCTGGPVLGTFPASAPLLVGAEIATFPLFSSAFFFLNSRMSMCLVCNSCSWSFSFCEGGNNCEFRFFCLIMVLFVRKSSLQKQIQKKISEFYFCHVIYFISGFFLQKKCITKSNTFYLTWSSFNCCKLSECSFSRTLSALKLAGGFSRLIDVSELAATLAGFTDTLAGFTATLAGLPATLAWLAATLAGLAATLAGWAATPPGLVVTLGALAVTLAALAVTLAAVCSLGSNTWLMISSDCWGLRRNGSPEKW